MIAAFAAGFQPKPLAFQLADFGGRSGYWRLVFAKMQEEALKEPKKEEAPKAEATITETAPLVKKLKVIRSKPAAPPPPEVHERYMLPVAIARPIRTLFDDLHSFSPIDVTSIRIDYSKIAARVAGEEVQRTRRKRRQVEELILLLAA